MFRSESLYRRGTRETPFGIDTRASVRPISPLSSPSRLYAALDTHLVTETKPCGSDSGARRDAVPTSLAQVSEARKQNQLQLRRNDELQLAARNGQTARVRQLLQAQADKDATSLQATLNPPIMPSPPQRTPHQRDMGSAWCCKLVEYPLSLTVDPFPKEGRPLRALVGRMGGLAAGGAGAAQRRS